MLLAVPSDTVKLVTFREEKLFNVACQLIIVVRPICKGVSSSCILSPPPTKNEGQGWIACCAAVCLHLIFLKITSLVAK